MVYGDLWSGLRKLIPYKTEQELATAAHPYYPRYHLMPKYAANSLDMPELLAIFAIGCTGLLSVTWFVLGKTFPRSHGWDKATVLWFTLSGTIHVFFEGYFVYNHANMGGKQDVFGQLWKEYALSDSRYLTSDTFTVCMEFITAACWGPLCYYVAFCVATSHPLRYPLQLIVSLGQMYGDVLYYATSMFDFFYHNVQHFRPEPFYFFGYYVLMNFFWILIPGILLWQSVSNTREAFEVRATMSKTIGKHGRITKPAANGHFKST